MAGVREIVLTFSCQDSKGIAAAVGPEAIYDQPADVYAPCALGGSLNEKTIPRLGCRIVCGAANAQLATAEDADRVAEAGILYAPDFIVNAGGLISAADELYGWERDRVLARTDRIGRTLLDVFHLATSTGHSPAQAAVDYAKARISRLDALTR
jgi:glutamate dehydrogenase/leucine dehydrogenase